MSPEFESLIDKIKKGELKTLDFLDQIHNIKDVEDDIVSALHQAYLALDWDLMQILVLSGMKYPSQRYTHILCKILELQSDHMTNEDVVDLLYDIKEPASVRTLRKVLEFDLENDEFHHLNIKAVGAIAHIGTDEAVEALMFAREQSQFLEVREAAREALLRKS